MEELLVGIWAKNWNGIGSLESLSYPPGIIYRSELRTGYKHSRKILCCMLSWKSQKEHKINKTPSILKPMHSTSVDAGQIPNEKSGLYNSISACGAESS